MGSQAATELDDLFKVPEVLSATSVAGRYVRRWFRQLEPGELQSRYEHLRKISPELAAEIKEDPAVSWPPQDEALEFARDESLYRFDPKLGF